MARPINKLTAREVAALKDPGRYSDGGGLYLRITPGGSKAWQFVHTLAGKRIEIGLGAIASVPLATARQLATEMREAAALGRDPKSTLASRQPAEVKLTPTFGEFAESYIASVETGWKNAVHRQQWRNSLRDHAQALHELPIDAITTNHVLAVLTPIWLQKSETAKRVRGRVEKVLDAAKARGLRPRDAMNPAAWRGHLSVLLPSQNRLQRGHHAALPFAEAPTFIAELRAREAVAARCLEFVILTAARSGEALGATWGELDLENQIWTVPAGRMKAGVEHVVPLSAAAMTVLNRLRPAELKPTDVVFAVAGAARSNMAMTMLLRRMQRGDITVHGFRSTFRDWAGDSTDYPRELIEHALAHTIQNKAERAYRRGKALDKRRSLMDSWAAFLC